MKNKWKNDKNNFLITHEDKMLMSQLPSSCQTEIYTQFIFRNFLWKFRRFFSLKMSEIASFQMVIKEKFGKKVQYDTKTPGEKCVNG